MVYFLCYFCEFKYQLTVSCYQQKYLPPATCQPKRRQQRHLI